VARVVDVRDPDQVRDFIVGADHEFDDLAGLVNNAGGYGPIGPLEDTTMAAWTDAITLNLLGTVAACREVIPILRRRGSGAIINLSGGGATAPLPRLTAYAAAKAAVVRFTESLAVELDGTAITVNAVAPGALNTTLLDDLLAAGPERAGDHLYARAVAQAAGGGDPIEQAAELIALLLSPDAAAVSGRLVSAVWDPWSTLIDDADKLIGTDIYTLRRIVPSDRSADQA